MKDEIRIRLSIGLIAVAVIHAILLPIVFKAFDRPEPAKQNQQPWNVPVRPTPTGDAVGKIEKLQEPQHVNLQAQGEIKQQIFNRAIIIIPIFLPKKSEIPKNPIRVLTTVRTDNSSVSVDTIDKKSESWIALKSKGETAKLNNTIFHFDR